MNLARTTAALASSVALIGIAGCSVTGSQVTSQQSVATAPSHRLDFLAQQYRSRTMVWQVNPGPGWISPDAAAQQLVYVSDENGQAVYIFPQKGHNPPPIGKITSGLAAPNGLFVDLARRLYVCNFGGGTVTVYRNGSITPSRTLRQAGSAIDVAVGTDGTVYVSDWDSGSAGHLLEYPRGHNTPTVTININGASEGLVLDSSNNLFVAYNDATNGDGEVLKFLPGSTVGTNLGIHVGYVGGESMDSQGNLLLNDQNVPAVDVFPPGATQPSNQIKGFALAFDVALNQGDSRLWVTDPFGPLVYKVAYPSGTIIDSLSNTFSSAFGVATSPNGAY
jgi:hypothetical protein